MLRHSVFISTLVVSYTDNQVCPGVRVTFPPPVPAASSWLFLLAVVPASIFLVNYVEFFAELLPELAFEFDAVGCLRNDPTLAILSITKAYRDHGILLLRCGLFVRQRALLP